MREKTTILLDVDQLFGEIPGRESHGNVSEESIPSEIRRYFRRAQLPLLLAAAAQAKERLKAGSAPGRSSKVLVWKNALEILGVRFDPALFEVERRHTRTVQRKTARSVRQLLQRAKEAGVKLGLVSERALAEEIPRLRSARIGRLCDFLVTSDETCEGAPPIALLELALRKAEVAASNALLVTGSPYYLEAAKALELETVSFRTPREGGVRPTYQVGNPLAILSLIGVSRSRKRRKRKCLVAFDLMGTIFEQPSFSRQVLWPVVHKRKRRLSFEDVERLYLGYSLGRLSDADVQRKLGAHVKSEALGSLTIRKDAVKTIRALRRRGCAIAVVSNIPAKWGRSILKQYGLESYVDVVIFSGTYESRKPDERLYRILLLKSRALPARTYLVDDKLANLRAARFLNIRTVFMQTEPKYVPFLPDHRIRRLSELLQIVSSRMRLPK